MTRRALRLLPKAGLLLLLLVPGLAAADAYLRVVSWNLRHEGWSGETNYLEDARQLWTQYGATSTSPDGVDVVFLQEVMYPTAAQGIAEALTQISGVPWAYSVTHAIGRSSYKECYAVLYRPDAVTLVSSSVYADVNDQFEREPQIVQLRVNDTQADYTFINWHTVFGTTTARQKEVDAIPDVFNAVLSASTNDRDVILLGDHNVSATSTWWSGLGNRVAPRINHRVNEQTTINSTGAYASPYDHFWFQPDYVTEFWAAGRDYVASPSALVSGLSDHAPIWITLYATGDTD
ncbi:MAG TPA: endonuclease/exonuclease/phosphatase family protein [Myxococcaceae bacterium]|nr:endonuclease/exonuclease/phosphatase family protein [Myxococcaceae bacterium]